MISDRQKAEDGYLFGLGIMKAYAMMTVEEDRLTLEEEQESEYLKEELEKSLKLLGIIEDRIKRLKNTLD